jgi:SpoIID/LytB domain protein
MTFRKATPAAVRAAAATSGRVLLYKGAPAPVFYSASCGGHTKRPSEVWSGAADPPFLPSCIDDASADEPPWPAVDRGRRE